MRHGVGTHLLGPRRRAGVYVIVLVVVAVVVAMVLTGGLLDRTRRRTARITGDELAARVLAASAIDLGLEIVRPSGWRSVNANGNWLTGLLLGSGTVDLVATDPVDGAITSGVEHPLVLTATGRVGEARQMVKVALQAEYDAMRCATGALHCAGALNFGAATKVTSLGTFSTNLTATANLSNINAPVEAGVAVVGTAFGGTTLALAGTRAVPDATVVDNFTAVTIPYSSLSGGVMRRCVLSPGNNPFGATSTTGTYAIDCGGNNITIRDVRIVGTLIILNAGSGSSITGAVNWQPAVANQPALLWVRGNLLINLGSGALDEQSSGNPNFNPASTPYRGTSDADLADTYPNTIRGIVYTSGSLTVSGTLNLQGVLIAAGAATISASADVTITGNPPITTSPSLGFLTGPTMTVVPGSWARVVE